MNPAYPLLDPNLIRQQLAHSPIGHTLIYHRTVPSTMPIAAELAQEPTTPSGVMVVAEEQSSGRGRRGRRWQAPFASALLVTIILKPPHCQLPASALTMVAGNALAAVAGMLPELAGELHLKWPNDLVLGSVPAGAAKVAGILAESSFSSDGAMLYAILGIGVNVNQQASEFPRIALPTPRPTSLRIAANRMIDRSTLLIQLCRRLSDGLLETPSATYQQWKSHLATLGQSVAVYTNGTEQTPTLVGQAIDAEEDGALIVVDTRGIQHSFYAADVSVRVAG